MKKEIDLIMFNYAFILGVITRIIANGLSFWVYTGVFIGMYLGSLVTYKKLRDLWYWKPEQRSIEDYK